MTFAWQIPAPLREGDVVRAVAPSGPFDREGFVAGVEILQQRGLQVAYDEAILSRHLYFAGDDARRVAEMRQAIADPQVRCIWSARGGYGSARVLPGLPVANLRQAAKWFVGFSDATALHAAWARAGLMSLHAANLHTSLASWEPDGVQALFAALMGDGHPPSALRGKTACGSGRVVGRLLGGNLTVLASLAGTPFLPSWKGAIVFLEDVGEQPYRLDRSLTQLRLAGQFAGVLGVALGQFTHCDSKSRTAPEVDAHRAILSALEGLNLPILTDLQVGHAADAYPLVLGGMATLDLDQASLRVDAAGTP
jgi:muramoyltetrapeptide carboxypeptidase